MYRLAQYVDQLVNVSSEALFTDEEAHECRLLAVEDIGVWLQSAELTLAMRGDVEGNDDLLDVPVFVPYAQVRCVTPAVQRIASSQARRVRELTFAARGNSPVPGRGSAAPERAKPKKAR